MKQGKIFFLALIHLFISTASASSSDSLFIDEFRKFAFRETGFGPGFDFYIKSSDQQKPYFYLYVSRRDRIESPDQSTFISFDTDEEGLRKKETELRQSGFETFCYKTYANSSVRLNDHFLAYPGEAQLFIIFHELIHNYFTENKIPIPYQFNEAVADVIGNYGTLKYCKTQGNITLESAEKQTHLNEAIYKCINKYIRKINNNPGKANSYHARCRARIKKLLKSGNTFQKDRFDYEVNNAYLLKNSNYCKNYFLVKRVFLKQKSAKEFLELIKNLPGSVSEYENFLRTYR